MNMTEVSCDWAIKKLELFHNHSPTIIPLQLTARNGIEVYHWLHIRASHTQGPRFDSLPETHLTHIFFLFLALTLVQFLDNRFKKTFSWKSAFTQEICTTEFLKIHPSKLENRSVTYSLLLETIMLDLWCTQIETVYVVI